MNEKFKGKISIILSTYNNAEALEIVLHSLLNQNDRNFEIIIADDGSTEDTKKLIKKISSNKKDIEIKHVWHPDEGFRLAKIRNDAVRVASGDYLIFLDGDCLTPPDFIKKHRYLAEQGRFVLGQRILMSEKFVTKEIKEELKKKGERFWHFKNLVKLWLNRKINRITPVVNIKLHGIRNLRGLNWKLMKGCNWATWTDDYKSVNGSDESFIGWGSEDKDLAIRLINSGVRVKDGRFYLWVLHIWHRTSSRENALHNEKKVYYRIKNKIILPEKGLK